MFELPERKHLVHKAIEPTKLSAKTRAAIDLPEGGVPEGDGWTYEYKYDGCHMIAVLNGKDIRLFSRTGEPVRSCQHIIDSLATLPPQHCVLFGEAWEPGVPHRTISGNFRRHSASPSLGYIVFDTVPLEDFIEGVCDISYATRREVRNDLVRAIRAPSVLLPITARSIRPGTKAKELANHPTDAYDGLVAKRFDGTWKAGAGTGGEVVKIKDRVSVDLRVIGVEEGEGKHKGRLGAIVCRYKDGKELRVGTGFSDSARELYWANGGAVIIGQIVEIHALGDSKKGSLREPRFEGIRYDKEAPDY